MRNDVAVTVTASRIGCARRAVPGVGRFRDVLSAIDFTTIEVWSVKGLVTYYLLAVMEVATRRVHFAGLTPCPQEAWMKQIARNLTAADDGFLLARRYLLMDRDSKFSAAFRTILADGGVKAGALAAALAHSERAPGTFLAQSA